MNYWTWLNTGEQKAYQEFAADFGRKFERWLRWNGFAQADAVDLAEDGTVEVLLRLKRFRPQEPVEQKFLAWAWKVARHFAEDWRRRHRPQDHEPLRDTLADPASVLGSAPLDQDEGNNQDEEAAARVLELRAKVETLSQKYSQVVLLKDFSGRATFGQVARSLGITENNARVRYHRALRLLRQIVATNAGL